MKKYKLKIPLLYLFSLPGLFVLIGLYYIWQGHCTFFYIINSLKNDIGLVVIAIEASLAMFLASFWIENYFPEVSEINHYLQRVVYILLFAVGFFVARVFVFLVTLGNYY